jgi:uncharacterized protein YjeT (DUF2065 family)
MESARAEESARGEHAMSLLDAIVSRSFRDEEAGRVVVFMGDRRHRGYLVKSEADELKIKSFLKMYFIAHLSILVFGYFLASAWASELNYALGRPAAHLYRTFGIALGVYSVVVGLPYLLLWRSYKKAFLNFVSPQDEVYVSGKRLGRRSRFEIAALVALGFATLILGGVILYLVRPK